MASGLMAVDILDVDIRPDEDKTKTKYIKILDQKELKFGQISGIGFAEASDLAYDPERNKLYMVGDEGILYAFSTRLTDKIEAITPLYAKVLSDQNGNNLPKNLADSEGLEIDTDGNLIISFEKTPRIERYSPNGKRIGKIPTSQNISVVGRYRKANKMLESVTYHKKYGFLTAPELPFIGVHPSLKTIYSNGGKSWSYRSANIPNNSITALQSMDNGNLLILERAKNGALSPITITLRELYLDQPMGRYYKTERLLTMSSKDGWVLDNFEGLARVGNNRYLMISDNNDTIFQKTILVYFEIL